MKRLIFFIFLFPTLLFAQYAGNEVYSYLNIPFSAREAAMGGSYMAVWDDDPFPALKNPSLLRDTLVGQTSLSYINYFSDINAGEASYIFKLKNWGVFNTGIEFINYGQIITANESGIITGKITAADYALVLGWGKRIDSVLNFGVNLKPLYSDFYHYNSVGIATDIALTYHTKKNFVAALEVNNLGTQIKRYTKENHEKMPYSINLGVSKKWPSFPFRISVSLCDIQQWKLKYDSLQNQPANNTLLINDSAKHTFGNTIDNALRHIVVGVEFSPSKNFNLRFGFNYRQRREEIISVRKGIAGFSGGIGFKISKFQFNYGIASYHLGSFSNVFSISTRISDFYHRKTS